MSNINFEDFHKVPGLSFDISRLRRDLKIVLEKKKFDTPGVSNFGAISLNQIPNDEDSIRGNNIRGVYWTKPDETGKEVTRDVGINESKYTQNLTVCFLSTKFNISVYIWILVFAESKKLGSW